MKTKSIFIHSKLPTPQHHGESKFLLSNFLETAFLKEGYGPLIIDTSPAEADVTKALLIQLEKAKETKKDNK